MANPLLSVSGPPKVNISTDPPTPLHHSASLASTIISTSLLLTIAALTGVRTAEKNAEVNNSIMMGTASLEKDLKDLNLHFHKAFIRTLLFKYTQVAKAFTPDMRLKV